MAGGVHGLGHTWQGHAWQWACMARDMLTATEVDGTHPTGMHSCYCYHLPMELREGNVFSCVCLSFCLSSVGSPCDHYS